jgi:hypothetical protein
MFIDMNEKKKLQSSTQPGLNARLVLRRPGFSTLDVIADKVVIERRENIYSHCEPCGFERNIFNSINEKYV